MKPASARRGVSLGNTLVVVAVASTLAFTVAAASMTHLNFSTGVSNGKRAQNVAESTLSLVLARVMEDQPALGEDRKIESAQIFQLNGGVGRVCFNQQQAREWDMPYSTNALAKENSVEGYDPLRPIPKNSAQFIAQGKVNGVTRTVEAVVYIPPFPYAVASAGPFHSAGQLEVGAHDELLAPGERPKPEDILSANLASNAPGARAMVIGPDSRISGDVRTSGSAEIDPSVYVGGRVRSGADSIKIPKENVTSYDPEMLSKPNLQPVPPGRSEQPVVQGFAKCKGDLRITGGLELDNGVLYVDGNLNVEGGVKGKGALFVTGNMSLSGSTSMQTDNQVAVLSGGNVTLVGSGAYSSQYQGLLYNEGAFKAERITLMGVLIQNDPNQATEIQDARLYYSPDQGRVEVDVRTPGAVDLSKGNIRMDAAGFLLGSILSPLTGTYVFEAYPVVGGGWELADPTNKRVYSLPDREAVKAKVKQLFHQGGSRGGLIGLGPNSQATLLPVPLALLSALYMTEVDKHVNAINEAPRQPGDSKMLPSTSDRLVIEPSKLLSMKDRIKLLYWRAR